MGVALFWVYDPAASASATRNAEVRQIFPIVEATE
jgi:hypothetical protein